MKAQPCGYPAHRDLGKDWQLKTGGPVVCGACHPPAVDPKRVKKA